MYVEALLLHVQGVLLTRVFLSELRKITLLLAGHGRQARLDTVQNGLDHQADGIAMSTCRPVLVLPCPSKIIMPIRKNLTIYQGKI